MRNRALARLHAGLRPALGFALGVLLTVSIVGALPERGQAPELPEHSVLPASNIGWLLDRDRRPLASSRGGGRCRNRRSGSARFGRGPSS